MDRQAVRGQAVVVWSKIYVTHTGVPHVGLWAEVHSKESECIHIKIIYMPLFQECAVHLPTINKESLWSHDQHVQPICALTTLLYVHD